MHFTHFNGRPAPPRAEPAPKGDQAMNSLQDKTQDRDVKSALRRGTRLKCPCCGRGALFRGYLKVADQCAVCDLDFTPQRADDGPAYVVILFVAHLVGFALPVMFEWMRDDPLLLASTLSLLAIILSLALLPPVKGGFIAFQWAKGLNGFAVRPGAAR